MPARYDVIVVGGGHNGLVSACYVAASGARVLVLERRGVVGGACVTEEIFPGFKFSTTSYVCSLLRPQIIRELQLGRYGFELLRYDPAIFVPLEDGRSLALWQDPQRTLEEIGKFSKKDARRYEEVEEFFQRISRFVTPLLDKAPPNIGSMHPSDLWSILRIAARSCGLGRKDLHALMRLMLSSAQDFLDENFESDALKSAFGAFSVIGAAAGPRTPGTAYVLLHHVIGGTDSHGKGSWGFVRGGMGTVTQALAKVARNRGVEVLTSSPVVRIRIHEGRTFGVTLESGEEIDAPVVVSNADPKRTFLSLIDEREVDSDYLRGIRNFKISGSSSKVNLALSKLPEFTCCPGPGPTPAHTGATEIASSLRNLEDGWDACKNGHIPQQPFCELVFPTTYDRTLVPEGKHILSVFVQYTPYHLAEGDWDSRREELGDRVLDTIGRYAPGLRECVLHRQVLTPLDLEREYGLTRGNIFHGDLIPSQLFSMRPLPGHSDYRTPVRGLYLCGSGTHPGGGVMGAAGRNAARQVVRDRLWRQHARAV
ncbi:MAG: NAD(P)/FAD-dependent oxidoreductase [Acidobacteriota bacterium]